MHPNIKDAQVEPCRTILPIALHIRQLTVGRFGQFPEIYRIDQGTHQRVVTQQCAVAPARQGGDVPQELHIFVGFQDQGVQIQKVVAALDRLLVTHGFGDLDAEFRREEDLSRRVVHHQLALHRTDGGNGLGGGGIDGLAVHDLAGVDDAGAVRLPAEHDHIGALLKGVQNARVHQGNAQLFFAGFAPVEAVHGLLAAGCVGIEQNVVGNHEKALLSKA